MRLVRLAAAVAAVIALCGCYLPTKFTAEIAITEDGDYTLNFAGTLAASGVAPGLSIGTPTPAQLTERIESARRDLIRDSGMQDIRYLGNGVYQVDYRRTGNIRAEKTLSFVRTDSKILTISYIKTNGDIVIRGATVPSSQRGWIRDAGFTVVGELRVTTSGKVKDHNATAVIDRDNGVKTYVWIIDGLDAPAPKLTLG